MGTHGVLKRLKCAVWPSRGGGGPRVTGSVRLRPRPDRTETHKTHENCARIRHGDTESTTQRSGQGMKKTDASGTRLEKKRCPHGSHRSHRGSFVPTVPASLTAPGDDVRG
ncbi:hypothetical protein AAFF_G00165870 [Aldrovandia affinis]|uniref:Uncharacterized protein n=1 Tax=Aldrovandia affinis TaxID=143900 RepID=A0AAD7R0L9_9TELE|nr:hypothetical protein AAFF_G00165870 [Aldrovandia affinis]